MIDLRTDVCGFFKFEAVKLDADGREISRRLLADWFPNLITDQGLNYFGNTSGWLEYCQVGSGSNTPNALDTALQSRIAGTGTSAGVTTGVQSTAPYFSWRRGVYRFAEGVAAGNISEVGVGVANVGGLFSRALVLDGGGSPTTITVLSDEVLDVAYEFRAYPPTVDGSGSFDLDGITYDFVSRAANVTSSSTTSGWGQTSGSGNTAALATAFVFNGSIGSITSAPGGTSSEASSISNIGYSPGSFTRDGVATWDLSRGNLSGGITAARISQGIGTFQFSFTPAIPKNSSRVLSLTFRRVWGRKVI